MANGRNLTTTRSQVFGDVEKGTECRICGRNVTDGRSKTCSDYCDNIQRAVMNMLNWSSVRRRIIDRDDETCQRCGFDMERERRCRDHIRHRIKSKLPDRPESPSALELGEGEAEEFDWDAHREKMEQWRERREELKQRYGDPYKHQGGLEVDHITPVSDGGHPFDPGNLQTLCDECHQSKTSRENSNRAAKQTPSRQEINETLHQYVSDS